MQGNAAAVPIAQSYKFAIVRGACQRPHALPLVIRCRQDAACVARGGDETIDHCGVLFSPMLRECVADIGYAGSDPQRAYRVLDGEDAACTTRLGLGRV